MEPDNQDNGFMESVFSLLISGVIIIFVLWLMCWGISKIYDSTQKPRPQEKWVYEDVIRRSNELRRAKGYYVEEPKPKKVIPMESKPDQFSDYEEVINFEGYEVWD